MSPGGPSPSPRRGHWQGGISLEVILKPPPAPTVLHLAFSFPCKEGIDETSTGWTVAGCPCIQAQTQMTGCSPLGSSLYLVGAKGESERQPLYPARLSPRETSDQVLDCGCQEAP